MSMPSLDPEETPPAAAEPALPLDDHAILTTATVSSGEMPALEEPPAIRAAEPAQIEPRPDGWALIALVPYDGREPPAQVSDELAQAVWCAVSALWHPSLLSSASRTAPDRVGRFAVATRGAGDPRDRRRTLGPASFRLPNAGRGCPDGPAGIGHRPRRARSLRFSHAPGGRRGSRRWSRAKG